MTEDIYGDFARRLGVPRKEAKRRTHERLYSGEPPRPKVEVLGPDDYVPPLKMARRPTDEES